MAESFEYKCPCCGGGLKFNASSQKIKCPFCESEFDTSEIIKLATQIDEKAAEKQAEFNTPHGSEWKNGEQDGLQEYTCSSCGGEIIADENTGATFCPYCNNPVILKGRVSGMLRPDYVIPFKTTKENMLAEFDKFCKGKVLLPKAFKREATVEEVKGIYVPYWLYDAEVFGRTQYEATNTHTYDTPDETVTETEHYYVARSGDMEFLHIPVDASKKMPDDLMESIEPFTFDEVKPFSTVYLSGFYADKYDVDVDDSSKRARTRIDQGVSNVLRDTVSGYSSVNETSRTVDYKKIRSDYALYPVWMMNLKWKDKAYTFAMNGQTGKMRGNLPLSGLLFALFLVLSFVLAGGIGGVIGYFIKGWTAAIIAGIVSGAIVCAIVGVLLYRQVKNVHFEKGASPYFKQDSFTLYERTDRYTHTTVTRVPKPRDNDKHK